MDPVAPTQPPRPVSIWKRIFISPGEPRLRAGWRLAVQTLLFLVISSCAGILIFVPVFLVSGFNLNGFPFLLSSEAVELIAVTLSVYLARRFVDRRSFSSLGFKLTRWALIDLLAGIGIALVMMGSIYWTMERLGWIHFQGFLWQSESPAAVIGGSLLILLGFILTGWNEELLSRGYHLQTIASGTNTLIGVLVSSAIFGLLHLSNPNASWVGVAGIFFAGIFLAFAYLRTGQLWLSIGLHIGWNFFEGPVFGFMVSGVDFFRLTRITVSGPVLWTGGAFGPEAGLIVLPAIAAGMLLIALYAKFRRRQVSPD